MNPKALNRFFGREFEVKSDYYSFQVEGGDQILLCSDGLSNFLSELDIIHAVTNNSPQEASDIMERKLLSKEIGAPERRHDTNQAERRPEPQEDGRDHREDGDEAVALGVDRRNHGTNGLHAVLISGPRADAARLPLARVKVKRSVPGDVKPPIRPAP